MCKKPSLQKRSGGELGSFPKAFAKPNMFRSSSSSSQASGVYPPHSHQELMPIAPTTVKIDSKTKQVEAMPMEFPSLKKDIDAIITSKLECKIVPVTPAKSHRFLFLGHIRKKRTEEVQKGHVEEFDDEYTDGFSEAEKEHADAPSSYTFDLKRGKTLIPPKVDWSKLLDATLGPNGPSAVQKRLLNVAERRLVDETFKFYMAILDYERDPTLSKARVMIELYVQAGAKFESGSVSSQTRELVIDIIAHKAQLKSKLTGKCFDAVKVELFRDISTNTDLGMIVMEAYGRDLLVGGNGGS